jgi:drug/metabolite transporter (DMT)-like permease
VTFTAIILTFISALCHASWNILIKKSTNPALYLALMGVCTTILVFPLAIYKLLFDTPNTLGFLLIGLTWILHLGYFTFLGQSYNRTNLNIVYPISRGFGLVLVQILSILILKESITLTAFLGASIIILGILGVGFLEISQIFISLRKTKKIIDRSILLTLLTGLTIACYSLIDKQGSYEVDPFLYVFFVNSAAIGVLIPMLYKFPIQKTKSFFINNWKSLIFASAFAYLGYSLIIFCYSFTNLNYISAFREISLILGIFLGYFILKENLTLPKILGTSLIILGAILIAI